MAAMHTSGLELVLNSTTTPLVANATYTGTWQEVVGFGSITCALKTDTSGTLYLDFSPDGINQDSSLSYSVTANINEVHRLTVTRRYCRVRLVNGATPQTFLRLQTLANHQEILSAPLNQSLQQDADAIVARTFTEEFTISEGLIQGYSVINKFGRNPDIDTGSVPEDIWNGGGVYTGFPTGAAEEFQVISSDAGDTGTLVITYLPTLDSTAFLSATIQLNGTTPVNTGVTGVRMHTARYSSGTSTGFNLGTITVRHITTTANVFCVMPIGRSQSNVAAYTVPAGHSARVVRFFCRVLGATSSTVEGALWIRARGESPRLRRPFTAAQQDSFEEEPYAGLQLNAGDDVVVRISSTATNNTDVIAGYDLILIRI